MAILEKHELDPDAFDIPGRAKQSPLGDAAWTNTTVSADALREAIFRAHRQMNAHVRAAAEQRARERMRAAMCGIYASPDV